MSVASQFGERAVKRYESYIKIVNENYPNCVIIDPTPLAFTTFSCRFRDAVRGIVEYNTRSDLLPEVANWANDFQVASLPGTSLAVIGRADMVRAKIKPVNNFEQTVGSVIDVAVSEVQDIETPSKEIVKACLLLITHNIIPNVVIRGSSLFFVESVIKESGFEGLREAMEQNGIVTIF